MATRRTSYSNANPATNRLDTAATAEAEPMALPAAFEPADGPGAAPSFVAVTTTTSVVKPGITPSGRFVDESNESVTLAAVLLLPVEPLSFSSVARVAMPISPFTSLKRAKPTLAVVPKFPIPWTPAGVPSFALSPSV
ncbi:hypothetical protein M408DRAFT_200620 [Serendipita vermifera MAFF 305830]|uniref:Uncharacterized protein n=1 Tax=Serendipita vermifera MAFF 305830 TaxID=933852 RepID=A0A0C2WPR0_SERVB|nr:hypothetical protein M408DRAFT_200620 [Serendipita vermifera MAFF 305830]